MQFSNNATVAFAVRWNAFGILLCSMPLIFQWKEKFPQTAVTLVVSDKNAPLVPYLQGYDRVLVIPHSFKAQCRAKIKLWPYTCDLAVSCFPRYSIEMDAILWSLNAKKKVSVIKNKWLNPFGIFTHYPVCEHTLEERRVHYSLAALRILFPESEEIPTRLYPRIILPKSQSLPNNAALKSLLLQDDAPSILISTSNNRECCSLGVQGYVEILNHLYSYKRFRVLISSLDTDLVDAVTISNQLLSPSCVVRTPKLGELLKLLSLADVVLVGDGGLMHMAAALNRLIVALFISRKLPRWHPLSKTAICFDHPEHVIKISKEKILAALTQQLELSHANRFKCY